MFLIIVPDSDPDIYIPWSEKMILCHFLGSGVILSFNIFGVNFFIIRKQKGHFLGCDFASLFSFVFENTENATVDLVCATC